MAHKLQAISKRKAEILRYVSQGYSARHIGEVLFVSPRTVENHLYQVQQLLGTKNAADSVGEALRRKIIE